MNAAKSIMIAWTPPIELAKSMTFNTFLEVITVPGSIPRLYSRRMFYLSPCLSKVKAFTELNFTYFSTKDGL